LSREASFLELVSGPGVSGRQGEPISHHSTLRVGGPAEFWLVAETEEGVSRALSWASDFGVKVRFHSDNGHLAREGGVSGLIIEIGALGWGVELQNNEINVGGFHPVAALAEWASRTRLSTFSSVAGAAGTVGASLRKGLFGDRVKAIKVIRGQQVREIDPSQLRDGHIILRVVLEAVLEGDRQLVLVSPDAINRGGAGQVFMDLPKQQTGDLIREAGMCGVRLRGAAIGTFEPNTILNLGGATTSDVLLLQKMMRDRIKLHSGVDVKPLIKAFGER